MNKHTLGPWFSQYDDNGFYEIGSEAAGLNIAFTFGESDTDEANARLIAAAPELLEAWTTGSEINTPDFMDWIADRLVNVYGENPNIDFVQSLRYRAKLIRAAIAKAKGEA